MSELPLRLSPAMNSRKIQALDYVTRFIGRWGKSPSYGEIAGALGVSTTRAKALVRLLERDGDLIRIRGQHRGLQLPPGSPRATLADALLRLRNAGYTVDDDAKSLIGPIPHLSHLFEPFPNQTLPLPLELDHIPDVEIGDGDDRDTELR